MTDIRKDFYPAPEHYNEPYDKRSFDAGYQAGRAHDVDGLIAEIHKIGGMSYNIAWGEAIDECLHIIRKHFGKE